ncbi:hypothetical protein R3P38DRAFT_1302936 [Favolaschia claudopus]|uniref:Uncharacterized protein n=1 Tax=Favolaschia claudopus TaxID=2862362 RepID=A0AAW0AYC8_9AGAR
MTIYLSPTPMELYKTHLPAHPLPTLIPPKQANLLQKMLAKFLDYALAALTLIGANPLQVPDSFDAATSTATLIEPGNYRLINIGRNESLFGLRMGSPVFTKANDNSTLVEWRVEPGTAPNEYTFFNIGLDTGMRTNNGGIYMSYLPRDDKSLSHVVTPVQGKPDTFIITVPRYGTWTAHKFDWDHNYEHAQVFCWPNTASEEQLWKFIRIDSI